MWASSRWFMEKYSMALDIAKSSAIYTMVSADSEGVVVSFDVIVVHHERACNFIVHFGPLACRKLAEVEVLTNDLVDGGLNGEPVVLINANFIVRSRSLYIVRALEVKDVVVTSGDFVQNM
ncbi:hypothetical protein CEXT_620741 [Caerostris extrusa]|uniref:Uncharacterized protein n=1 Tax=Caerostris extrusa TaxID=172846 RepID=A0AAV4MQQ6_CAEEX|nr:hypothetical protein CEXT_620741 [Caerostris extrusa]